MPPTENKLPKPVTPYSFQGIQLKDGGSDQFVGTCPFCLKEKFYVDKIKGLWRCIICPSGGKKGGGNPVVFLRELWEEGERTTTDYKELKEARGLLNPDTLVSWQLIKSPIRPKEWLVPGFQANMNLTQLYRYVLNPKSQKRALMATPEVGGHAIHGLNLFDTKKPKVFICEGPWDAMVLWEVLNGAKVDGPDYAVTGNRTYSLGEEINVIAMPGCNVYHEKWNPLFAGKEVTIFFDSDHEKVVNGKTIPPAGWSGAERMAAQMARAEHPPASIHVAKWGENGWDPDLKSGYDLRDYFLQESTLAGRVKLLSGLFDRVVPIPDDWVGGRTGAAAATGSVEMQLLPCDNWETLTNSWKKAMKWIDGLDHALAAMLAAASSTMMVGDQLWLKIIGPPSCGKSTLAEALSTNKQYTLAKSTIRGFHSGFQSNREDTNDNSLLALANGKCLITKDGDTLLKAPNFDQILSEARDIYDRKSRTHYRNAQARDYEKINMPWLLMGTSALREMDASELGARFMDVVVMEGIDNDLEDEILYRVANRSARNAATEVDETAEGQLDEALVEAYQLTGGYLSYLRENAKTLTAEVEKSDDAIRQCIDLGKFVAFVRARPSKKQDETVEREFGARLVSVIVRLATFLAITINRKSLDEEVMRRTRLIALNTARGVTLNLIAALAPYKTEGTVPATLVLALGEQNNKVILLLRFLRKIGAVEQYTNQAMKGSKIVNVPRWRLTKTMMGLYTRIMDRQNGVVPLKGV